MTRPTARSSRGGFPTARALDLVQVERIAAGGDGVGREASGRVVFVPRTAPGDVVRVEIDEARSRWARGRVREFVRKGTGRRSAPCPIYEVCGGCRLQHLTPEEQRRSKRELVEETLRRIGKMEIEVPDLIAAGSEFGYRNRITFSTARAVGSTIAGYRRIGSPGEVVDVSECMLGEPAIVSAWTALRATWDSGLADILAEPGTRVTIRASSDGAVDLVVRGGKGCRPEVAAALMGRVPGLVGWHQARGGKPPRCLAGSEVLRDRWQGVEFALPADVFLQVNRAVSSAMDRWLDERCGEIEGRRILDLYAGVGARAIRWAEEGADVVSCEVSAPAGAACRAAASRTEGRLEIVTDRVENRIASLLPANIVVVNPPRAGLSSAVADALVTGSADHLAYVSCDAATLARDLDRLRPAWALAEIQPFDAFPQTAHVETVAWLNRA